MEKSNFKFPDLNKLADNGVLIQFLTENTNLDLYKIIGNGEIKFQISRSVQNRWKWSINPVLKNANTNLDKIVDNGGIKFHYSDLYKMAGNRGINPVLKKNANPYLYKIAGNGGINPVHKKMQIQIYKKKQMAMNE